MTELLTAPQVARLLGVTATTIKRWEASGLLEAHLTPGGHYRFKRDEIVRYRHAQSGQPDDLPGQLIELMLGGDDDFVLQGVIVQMRGRLGAWYRVADELGKALTELGRQWELGVRTVAEEHVATRRIQHALWACMASLPSPPGQPRCLLAAAQGEDHTLGLSLAKLCLREAGWNTIWLGSPTPGAVLIEAIGNYQPQMVTVTASSFSSDSEDLEAQYRKIADACRQCGAEIVLGGEGSWPDRPTHGHRVRTFAEFAALLGRDR
jgi:excisionase family DNA binding protein